MLVYLQSTIALILGVISLITDIKHKKIYNKNIIIALIISTICYICLYKRIEVEFILNFTVNLIITAIISFLFYYLKIWAAGDAKLFLSIVYMIPFEIYEVDKLNIFPALNLLIIIFSIAFIYIFFETIFLWIKDKEKFEMLSIKKITKIDIIDFTIQYFLGYFTILFINNILNKYFLEFETNNGGLILLCNMLILIFEFRILKSEKSKIITLAIMMILNITYLFIYGIEISSINLKMLLLVLLILIFRRISEKYNYEEIRIDELKPRMILSYTTIIRFYGSKVKGLPKSTTENTDSRITEDEVESIKRWSKTSRGSQTITIVRHIPFAPFILTGELVFFILKLYL